MFITGLDKSFVSLYIRIRLLAMSEGSTVGRYPRRLARK